jgi:acetylornithine deacetylase/succinyl-diaminopimelate desuccinylase-like protein
LRTLGAGRGHGPCRGSAANGAKRLRDAGFPEKDITVAGPNERKKNLVVRIHGTAKRKAILFIGHLDVVEARREDWTTDPFELV